MSVAELYRIGDTIEIREQGGAGRMVSLHPSLQRTPTPEEGTDSEVRYNPAHEILVLITIIMVTSKISCISSLEVVHSHTSVITAHTNEVKKMKG